MFFLTMVLVGYAVLLQQLLINGGLEYGSMKWEVGFETATDGGGTIGLSDTATGVAYALYVFNNTISSSGGETHTQWLNGNITLNSNTRYVAISFKNGDGSSSFTSEQLSLLPTYLEFK